MIDSLSPPTSVSPPQLGPYQIGPLLGEGGQTRVYLAKDLTHAPPLTVALKVLDLSAFHLQVDAEEGVLRLMDEARIGGLLDHPNLVRLIEVGRAERSAWLANEYVHGVSLATLTRRARRRQVPLPLESTLWVWRALTRGLAHLHEARDPKGRPLDIVHRDLKPGNVLLSTEGEVKLTDYGISRAHCNLHRTLIPGMISGTPAYMSPEQAQQRPELDARSDLFSLGLMVYEMLTAKRLYKGQRWDCLISARKGDTAEAVKEVAGRYGDAIADALRTCLAPEREERVPDARILGSRLDALLEGVDLDGARVRLGEEIGALMVGAAEPQTEASAQEAAPLLSELLEWCWIPEDDAPPAEGDHLQVAGAPDGHLLDPAPTAACREPALVPLPRSEPWESLVFQPSVRGAQGVSAERPVKRGSITFPRAAALMAITVMMGLSAPGDGGGAQLYEGVSAATLSEASGERPTPPEADADPSRIPPSPPPKLESGATKLAADPATEAEPETSSTPDAFVTTALALSLSELEPEPLVHGPRPAPGGRETEQAKAPTVVISKGGGDRRSAGVAQRAPASGESHRPAAIAATAPVGEVVRRGHRWPGVCDVPEVALTTLPDAAPDAVRLLIGADQGSDIHIEGISMGQSPLACWLTPGPYIVELKREGVQLRRVVSLTDHRSTWLFGDWARGEMRMR